MVYTRDEVQAERDLSSESASAWGGNSVYDGKKVGSERAVSCDLQV